MNMKVVVISDSHGNIANLKHVLGFAKKIKAGAIIHCGDWDNIEAINTVLSFNLPIYTVLGNADISPEVEKSLEENSKKFDPEFLRIKIGGRKIGIVHSFINHESLAINHDIVFAGHRHFKGEEIVGGVKIIHPGALHSNESSFAVYETDTNKVEFIDLL